jgi:prolyl-tRNA editing enzyme YbaK/EbsC (Cys-tRNA(Pro) deacylase)
VRSFTDVHDELTGRRVPHEIVHLPSSSRTAQLAAEALGVPVGEAVKSLLFLVDDAPVLALVSGDATVDTDALAREMGVAQVRFAKRREVREFTGYAPGAAPPCALAMEVPVVADPGVRRTWCTAAAG